MRTTGQLLQRSSPSAPTLAPARLLSFHARSTSLFIVLNPLCDFWAPPGEWIVRQHETRMGNQQYWTAQGRACWCDARPAPPCEKSSPLALGVPPQRACVMRSESQPLPHPNPLCPASTDHTTSPHLSVRLCLMCSRTQRTPRGYSSMRSRQRCPRGQRPSPARRWTSGPRTHHTF